MLNMIIWILAVVLNFVQSSNFKFHEIYVQKDEGVIFRTLCDLKVQQCFFTDFKKSTFEKTIAKCENMKADLIEPTDSLDNLRISEVINALGFKKDREFWLGMSLQSKRYCKKSLILSRYLHTHHH